MPSPCKVDSIDETDSVDFVADLMKACLIKQHLLWV